MRSNGLGSEQTNGQVSAQANGEVAKAWNTVRAHLRESAGARLFDKWLKPIELTPESDTDTVRLALPSAFMTNWVSNHYADRLLAEFRMQIPGVRSVSIETRSAIPQVAALRVEAVDAPQDAPTPVATIATPGVVRERPPLDPRFTFDRFVVDPSNRVAFNAARALAEPGVPRFSPLFLHGGTGQGKSHLMHAIGAAYLLAVPQANVILMSAERFMFDFVQAIRARDTHGFKARLRAADLLLIDDLQFIAGKDSTQEEFFHTINEVMGAGKRLVISADRCPQGLDGIELRITSRLSCGLVADIKAPDLTLRRAVLARKLIDMPEVSAPAEVLDLLAARITANIRDLEGALNRLVAYSQLTGDPIDMDFAVATLGDMLRGAERRVTIDEIQKAVSAHFELKPVDLVSARRAVVVARPRQIAMYLAKRLTTRSLPEIGRKFGGRDHSTVIHAVRRIEELRDKDRDIDAAVRTLLHTLEG
ncbi:chromosomal replication initiator protein DnaA [Sphingomonas immobilis]|uniref:chromosomal replication initiator protein DnaA n=1 Tax=Sphingomonas immobilis TaxID=3063997 RepID=UPI003D673A1D